MVIICLQTRANMTENRINVSTHFSLAKHVHGQGYKQKNYLLRFSLLGSLKYKGLNLPSPLSEIYLFYRKHIPIINNTNELDP